MNISKFTFSEPNDSGYISLSLDAAIENKSEFDIELVDGLVIIVDANGVTIGGAEIFPEGQKVSIASKESGEICVFGNSIQKGQVSDGIGAEVKAYLSLNTYRRVSVKIGSLDVPNEPGEMTAIKKVVSTGFYTMGDFVSKFESNFAEFFKSKYAVMVNSGSSANLLAIASLFFIKIIRIS